MKIIQITSGEDALYGLSDDGKLYWWQEHFGEWILNTKVETAKAIRRMNEDLAVKADVRRF